MEKPLAKKDTITGRKTLRINERPHIICAFTQRKDIVLAALAPTSLPPLQHGTINLEPIYYQCLLPVPPSPY